MSLGIFLLWSVNHSFHKRNENDFFTWVSLDMVAVCVPLLLTFETWWFNKILLHVLTTHPFSSVSLRDGQWCQVAPVYTILYNIWGTQPFLRGIEEAAQILPAILFYMERSIPDLICLHNISKTNVQGIFSLVDYF